MGSETFTEYREIEGINIPMHVRGIHLTLGNYTAQVRDVRFV
jgi:hypothetical protein